MTKRLIIFYQNARMIYHAEKETQQIRQVF